MDIETRRKEIRSRIVELVTATRLSKRKLAKLMGRDKTTPSHWTSGRTEPDLATVAELLVLAGKSADWLLGTEAPPSTFAIAEATEPYGGDASDVQRRAEGVVDAKLVEVTLNRFMDEMRDRMRALEKTVERVAAPATKKSGR